MIEDSEVAKALKEKDEELDAIECTEAFEGEITLSVEDLSQGGLTSTFTFNLQIPKPSNSYKACQ